MGLLMMYDYDRGVWDTYVINKEALQCLYEKGREGCIDRYLEEE